ncbi:histidine phosphatase family protein [Pelomicrobium methylotrophicum]|uniref:histidine phosphatase family protein n=1 Tax=Pelomicrobium methylotrophicum TaxID=2602750 RepID=UPI001969FBAD|nr:histidine phosphatase family protein [Pelomicrobium methylotrophicum]
MKVQKGWFDLLRHGETEGGQRYRGVTDDPLTDAGWEQMWRAVRGKGLWDRIVTSPLERCAAFAEALAARHAIVLEVDERWREIDFGAWEGHTVEELMAQDPQALERFWRDPLAHPPPGGERLAAFRDRVLAAWRELASRCWGQRVLIVTHAGPIRVVLAHLSGWPANGLLSIEVPLASLMRLRPQGVRAVEGGWKAAGVARRGEGVGD